MMIEPGAHILLPHPRRVRLHRDVSRHRDDDLRRRPCRQDFRQGAQIVFRGAVRCQAEG